MDSYICLLATICQGALLHITSINDMFYFKIKFLTDLNEYQRYK